MKWYFECFRAGRECIYIAVQTRQVLVISEKNAAVYGRSGLRFDNCILDIPQTVFAEENFVANKKGG